MTNLSIRILVIVLKHSVAIRAIFVLRYVSIVFGLVEVVRHRHYPSYVVDKATTERSRRKEMQNLEQLSSQPLGATAAAYASWLRTRWSPWWKWLDYAPRSCDWKGTLGARTPRILFRFGTENGRRVFWTLKVLFRFCCPPGRCIY